MPRVLQMLRHLRNPQLVATYAVGFGVLFNFIAIFTYVSFHLAAPPYNFSPSLLGALFFTYLVGTVATPWTGRVVMRYGRRTVMIGVISVWLVGLALLLASPLALILPDWPFPVCRVRDAVPGDLDGFMSRRAPTRDAHPRSASTSVASFLVHRTAADEGSY